MSLAGRNGIDGRRQRAVAEWVAAAIVSIRPPVTASLASDSRPQFTLIQLLPSSPVADGVKLKTGFGVTAFEMPRGTPNLLGPLHRSATVHSGETREPLQHWLTTGGAPELLVASYPVVDVITE